MIWKSPRIRTGAVLEQQYNFRGKRENDIGMADDCN